jgi:hypothetical protein
MSLRDKYARPHADYDLDWPPGPGSVGAAHSVSGDRPDRDIVQELHDTVEEVTRKPVARAARKIGFY